MQIEQERSSVVKITEVLLQIVFDIITIAFTSITITLIIMFTALLFADLFFPATHYHLAKLTKEVHH